MDNKFQNLLEATLSAEKEGKTLTVGELKNISIDGKKSIYQNLATVVQSLVKNLQLYIESAYRPGWYEKSIYQLQHKKAPPNFEKKWYDGNKSYTRTGGIIDTVGKINRKQAPTRFNVSVTGNTIEAYWAFGVSHYHPSLFGEYKGKYVNTLKLLDQGYSWKNKNVRIKWFTYRRKGRIIEGTKAATIRENGKIVKALGLNIEIEAGRDVF